MYPLIVFGALALILIGFYMGSSLGRRLRGLPATSQSTAQAPGIDPRTVTPMQDLILSPDEVVDKSIRTTRLLSALATNEPLFDPEQYHRQWIHSTTSSERPRGVKTVRQRSLNVCQRSLNGR